MGSFVDIAGRKFGRWEAVRRSTVDKHGMVMWLCRCSCGVERDVVGADLRSGKTKSCGCLQKELTVKRSRKHGHNSAGNPSRTYVTWSNMIQRCNNPKNNRYEDYGGRGIEVCHRWNSFENFLSDMGEKPLGKSIDRINNNGNYEQHNCRWATWEQQANNRRPARHRN